MLYYLKNNPNKYAGHPAWNFHGTIYFKEGVWTEEVWRYGACVEILTSEDVEELIEEVNFKYGYE